MIAQNHFDSVLLFPILGGRTSAIQGLDSVMSVDVLQKITDLVIDALEKGEFSPWECPWVKTNESPIPYNYLTRDYYSGVNILILWFAQRERRYSHNAWLTFNQAKQLGGVVRKGEVGVPCVFYKPVSKTELIDGEEKDKSYLCRKSFYLFNIDQIEGIEAIDLLSIQPIYEESEVVNRINHCAEKYCEVENLTIRHGGDQAFYSPALDLIKMPITFKNSYGYAATLAHELIHSTGHRTRLNRFEEFDNSFETEDEAYSLEELVAEMGSQILLSMQKIDIENANHLGQHVSYVNSWLKKLRGDKSFVFKAAGYAFKAATLIASASESASDRSELNAA